MGQPRFICHARLRTNLLAFPEYLSDDNYAKFFGFLDSQRVEALTQRLEARFLPLFDYILCSQCVLVDWINLWSARVDSLDRNGPDQVELVFRRDGEEVYPMLE